MTEDADIGLRLARMGYHCGVFGAPTLEDAPAVWSVWLAQRSRWFKGWLQTLLVHFRDPVRLYREIGLAGYLTVMVTTGGMLFSALTHPLIIVFIGYTVWRLAASGTGFSNNLQAILFIMDMFNIAGSYALFALMGGSAMSKGEKRRVGRPWLGIPVYWLMLSVAAWKAIYEIRRDPFLWRKTPHEPSSDPQNLKAALPRRPATGN